jgi:chromosomal replication initiator protein
MIQEEWGQLSQRLLKSIGQNNFKTWIEPLKFRDLQDGIATFHVPTNFLGNYVSQNFSEAILHELRVVDASVCRLSFAVPTHAPKRPAIQKEAAPVAAPARSPLNTAPMDKRFTFDSFIVGKPNELAHAAAKRVAEGGPVTFNPLFLYGGVGLGKTHLMHAIAWELQTTRPDLNVLYLSAEQFMYRFVQALRDRKMMDFKEIFRSVDVLMVDDVQFIAGKDSTQEEFFHTFNALVDQNKQIIISADRAPGEIKDLEDRQPNHIGGAT